MDLKNTLVERVAEQLVPRLPVHASILVGLSGGVDSVVLLHLLHRLGADHSWQLSALHVHHGISSNADQWADFCTRLCANYSIPLHVEHVDITPLRALGIEAAARKLRQETFARQACDFVILGHHADDQAETLLLQLLRGAGVRGSSAMPVLSSSKRPVLITSDLPARGLSRMASSSTSQPKQPLYPEHAGSPAVLRPLLHCSRRDIMAYAIEHGLQWMEDESNADDNYPRNFLRNRVLPLLEERFPSYRETLGRSARHFAEAGGLLDELASQDAGQSLDGDTLPVAALRSLSQPRAKNLLRYFLHGQGASMPQSTHLEEMLRQFCDARPDAAVSMPCGDRLVRRYQDRLYVLPVAAEFDRDYVLTWQGEDFLEWPPLASRLHFSSSRGAGASLKKLQHAPLTVRLRRGSEALRLHPAAAKRSLKNLLQQYHIPPWQRERWPLLFSGEELVCVVGLGINADYQALENEDGLLVSCG